MLSPLGCSPVAQTVKASACSAEDPGSIPALGRSPGEGNSNPLQYSCLENPMDGEAWQATLHGAAKSQTQLSYFTLLFSPFTFASIDRVSFKSTILLFHHNI